MMREGVLVRRPIYQPHGFELGMMVNEARYRGYPAINDVIGRIQLMFRITLEEATRIVEELRQLTPGELTKLTVSHLGGAAAGAFDGIIIRGGNIALRILGQCAFTIPEVVVLRNYPALLQLATTFGASGVYILNAMNGGFETYASTRKLIYDFLTRQLG